MSSSKKTKIELETYDFWRWLFRSGLRSFIDRWLVLHLTIGALLALSRVTLKNISPTVMFSVMGAIVGLSVALLSNLVPILQSDGIKKMVKRNGLNYLKNIINKFQLAILLMFMLLLTWTIVQIHMGSIYWLYNNYYYCLISRFFVYVFSSLVIRECWQAISGLRFLIISSVAVEIDGES